MVLSSAIFPYFDAARLTFRKGGRSFNEVECFRGIFDLFNSGKGRGERFSRPIFARTSLTQDLQELISNSNLYCT